MTRVAAWKPFWKSKRQLLIFALLFQTAESVLFAPLLGLAGHALLGRPVVDSTEIVSFILSPRGFLLLFCAAVAALTIRLLEHAGLSVIVLGALQGKTVRVLTALRLILIQLPRLASIGMRIIGCGLLVVMPVLTVAGLFASRLLPTHDINFYLARRPPEFMTAALVIGVVAIVTLAVSAWLFVRWRLVVQTCLFDGKRGWGAFREAAILSRGVWWQLGWRCLAILALGLALASAATGLGQLVVRLVFDVGRIGTLSLAVSLGLLLLLRTVVAAAIISIGAGIDAVVFTAYYRKRRQIVSGESTLPFSIPDAMTERTAPGARRVQVWALVVIVIGLCESEMVGLFVMLDALKHEPPIAVTAHRGGHLRAPENTVASIHEAIADGAQYAEIDVQMTKDSVLVVTHDSDFSRMAGVPKKVWDLTYSEIRAIPLGAHSAPEFRNEPAPTFNELLAAARDRIKLNVELKYYGDHQPHLAERVVAAVKAQGMANQVIIQCLKYKPLQEVRRLAPEIPVGYLMSVNARKPSRLKVDFLGAEFNRVTGAFVQKAHRQGQQVHVWTVDKSESIDRVIDLGADNIITNQAAEAVRRLHEYESLTALERALRRARAWLAN
jgi:glycerophosphoryl diester phosphodiesterase